ncbi:MAG: TonB-dependent receptor [Agarilytica sp.]
MIKTAILVLGSTAVLYTNLCNAQSTDKPNEKTVPQVEEVWVSAQKKNERLLDVPISIDVINREFIEQSGAFGISDLEMAMPSVNFGRGGRKIRGEIAIRGVGDYSRNIGTGARVAVYVDEVPLGRSSAFDASLIDVKQIEILKGPQGTLFGSNSIAGAISIYSQDPTQENSGTLKASGGMRGYGSYSLNTNLEVSETLQVRAQFGHEESDGHIKNIHTGEHLQGSDINSARLTLLWQPSDVLQVRWSSDGLTDSSNATNAERLDDPQAPDIFEVSHDTYELEERKIWGSALKTTWKIADSFQFDSITGYRKSSFSSLSEEDYSRNEPDPINFPGVFGLPVSDSLFDEEYEQVSQEVRLGFESSHFDALIGAFALHSNLSTERHAKLLNTFSAPPPLYLEVQTPGTLDSRNYAVFGSGDLKISDKLSVSAGARWKTENKTLDYAINDTTPFFTTDQLSDEESYSAFLPKLSLQLHNVLGNLLYASVARGEKSGGWNADFVSDINDIEFDSEYSINYEIGNKTQLANNRVRIQSAIFHTNFTDFQVFQFDNSQTTIRNAAEATSKGVELEVKTLLNHYVDLTLALSVTETKYNTFQNASSDGDDYSGNKLQYAPESSIYSAIDAALPYSLTGQDSHHVHLNIGYTDDYFSGPANNEESESIDSYYIVNGHYTIAFGDEIELMLWGKNLTDEEILRSRGESFLGIPRGYYEQPRTMGVSFSTKF